MYLNRAEEIANIIKANTTAVSEPKEVIIPITIESSYPKVTAIDKKFSDMGINNIAPLAQNTSTAFNNIFLCSKAVQRKFRDSGSYFNVYRCR